MSDEGTKRKYAYFSTDTAEYFFSQSKNQPLFDLLEGNPKPLIEQLNKEQTTDFTIFLYKPRKSGYEDPVQLALTDQQIDYIGSVLTQVPTIEFFQITANFTASQATQLANHIANSNLEEIEINNTNANFINDSFVQALSNSHVTGLRFNSVLDQTSISALQFKNLDIDSVGFSHTKFTDLGLTTIFQNMYGSEVKEVSVTDVNVSKKALDAIDFSKTNIQLLDFFMANFEKDAFSGLHLKNSSIQELDIQTPYLTKENLTALSEHLKNSSVSTLHLEVKAFKGNELSYLNLKGTPIETLEVWIEPQWSEKPYGAKAFQYLNLNGTSVKTLDLSLSDIHDEHLKFLHLKNTPVEHLILNYNEISLQGLEELIDIVKDTNVTDITYCPGFGVMDEFAAYPDEIKIFVSHGDDHSVTINFQDVISGPNLFANVAPSPSPLPANEPSAFYIQHEHHILTEHLPIMV